MPDAASRVAAYLLLMQGVVEGNDDIRRFLEQALVEAGDDQRLRAQVLVELAENDAVVAVARIAEAERGAAEAVALGGATDAAPPRRSPPSPGPARSAGVPSTTCASSTEPCRVST